MSEPAREKAAQLVWRIPSYQPAVLMLVLCAAAALNIYAHPPAVVRIPTLAIGLVCGALAVAALRLQLVATADGVSVRQLTGERWTSWEDLADVEVIANLRGAPSLRLNRTDGSYVEVPPSLLQPTRPTPKRVVLRNLEVVAGQLEARRRTGRSTG
ncbi:MAG TPA: PH domain-containing protein [Jatrophihabitans sp.]|nr:PH domain-containing protein [Jatrophihabitans sp.]